MMISLGSPGGARLARVLSSLLVVTFSLCAVLEISAADHRTRFAVAPSITTQPVSRTVVAGQTASFSVAVTGTAPLTYQWRKNGNAIRGATSSTYTISPTTTANTGSQYTVIVGNSAGRVTSSAAMLTVVAPKPVAVTPSVTSNTGSGTGTTSGATTSSTTTGSTGSVPPPGTATLVFTPATLSLGSITIGSSNTLAAMLTNTGTASASITNVSISGPGFTVSGAPAGQTLAPAQGVALNVVFAPASAGSVTGSVTVTSDASNQSVTLTLSGAGVQPPVSHSTSLSWSPSSSTVTGYHIYRGTVSGGPYSLLNGSLIPSTSYLDSGVQAGNTYFYVATAVDGNNMESAYSNEISAAVP